jgi:hypothetical protein
VSGNLWRWDGGYARRPAAIAEVDFVAAGAPADATVERVEVGVTATASSEEGGAPSTGVDLLLGEPVGWRTFATGTGAGGVSLAYCESRTPAAGCTTAREGRLLLGRSRTLLVGAAPSGTNGRGVAQVDLDYVEARVTYRLPEP